MDEKDSTEANWPEVMSKLLDKIPLDKVYEHLFQSGMEEAGQLLKRVLQVPNLIFLPISIAGYFGATMPALSVSWVPLQRGQQYS